MFFFFYPSVQVGFDLSFPCSDTKGPVPRPQPFRLPFSLFLLLGLKKKERERIERRFCDTGWLRVSVDSPLRPLTSHVVVGSLYVWSRLLPVLDVSSKRKIPEWKVPSSTLWHIGVETISNYFPLSPPLSVHKVRLFISVLGLDLVTEGREGKRKEGREGEKGWGQEGGKTGCKEGRTEKEMWDLRPQTHYTKTTTIKEDWEGQKEVRKEFNEGPGRSTEYPGRDSSYNRPLFETPSSRT